MDTALLHDLPLRMAAVAPESPALTYQSKTLSYGKLAESIERFAGRLVDLGIARGERVGIYLEKRFEFVIAAFGTMRAGAVFVPLNPLLKAEQVAYILRDCNVRVLVTSAERLGALASALPQCHDLRHIVVIGTRGRAASRSSMRSCLGMTCRRRARREATV